jgi:organic radical activating enzyme
MAPASPDTVPLVEIFRSFQGEGPHVGRPTVFVRTAVCPLRCLYCDSVHTFEPQPRFRVHAVGEAAREEPNPCDVARAAGIVTELARGVPLTVSFTGGEPLVWPCFIAGVAQLLRPQGFRTHLETAALDPDAFAQVAAQIDHLSADYKLPSTLERDDPRPRNVACVQLAVARGIETSVKVVLTDAVPEAEWRQAMADLSPLRTHVTLVLQPVTRFHKVTTELSRERLWRCAEAARELGFELRVLPQVHRLLDVP